MVTGIFIKSGAKRVCEIPAARTTEEESDLAQSVTVGHRGGNLAVWGALVLIL